MPHEPPAAVVRLTDTESGRQVELPVRQAADMGVTRFAGMRWHNYDQGELTVLVDAAELVSLSQPGKAVTWQLEVEMTAAGVTRSGPVEHRDSNGSPGVGEPRVVSGQLVCLQHGAGPVTLRVTTPRASLLEASTEGRCASGTISLPADSPPTRLVASRNGREVFAPLSLHDDGGHRFSLELPAEELSSTDPGARGWGLRVVTSDGEEPIAWPEDSPDAWLGAGTTSELAFHRTPRGNTLLMEVRGLAQLEDVSLDGTTLTVRGSWLGVPLDGWSLVLQGSRTRLPGSPAEQDERGRFMVDVPLVWDEWGLGSTCVPLGSHRVVLTQGKPLHEDDVHALMIGTALERELPVEQVSEFYRVRLSRGAAGRPLLGLLKPYADDERRAYCQQVLRTAYQNSSPPIDENAVYLQ